jgi:hypothetical protein
LSRASYPGTVRYASAVLLLHVRAVVLLPRAAAGKGDAVALAPRQEVPIDELAAVIAVEADEGHGQAFAHPMHGAPDPLLVLAPDPLELDPRRGDATAQSVQR